MKRRIFLFAVLLPCIAFALTAMFAFKPEGGKPVIETSAKQVYDDSDAYWAQQMAELDAIAYDTWVADGSPGGDDFKANKDGSFNHYCCKTSGWLLAGQRAAWVEEQMGGSNNPNHVHYIDWEKDYAGGPTFRGYKVSVKYWTNAPCSEFCDW